MWRGAPVLEYSKILFLLIFPLFPCFLVSLAVGTYHNASLFLKHCLMFSNCLLYSILSFRCAIFISAFAVTLPRASPFVKVFLRDLLVYIFQSVVS
jgi:hypothetical protein